MSAGDRALREVIELKAQMARQAQAEERSEVEHAFTVVEDRYQPEQHKRWVLVAPPGSNGPTLLLARASTPEQEHTIGNQTGGRVFLFLYTDDFWRDFRAYKAQGVEFVREPSEAPYGTVAVFKDLYGTLWDLVQPKGAG